MYKIICLNFTKFIALFITLKGISRSILIVFMPKLKY